MSDVNDKIEELADLMQEFELDRASLKGEDWVIEFARTPRHRIIAAVPESSVALPAPPAPGAKKPPKAAPASPVGTPITSPMTGIYYASPSPGSPVFVKVGDQVTAGQVVGLIEAMKVFSEITTAISGTVSQMVAKDGSMVNPGEPLIYVS